MALIIRKTQKEHSVIFLTFYQKIFPRFRSTSHILNKWMIKLKVF